MANLLRLSKVHRASSALNRTATSLTYRTTVHSIGATAPSIGATAHSIGATAPSSFSNNNTKLGFSKTLDRLSKSHLAAAPSSASLLLTDRADAPSSASSAQFHSANSPRLPRHRGFTNNHTALGIPRPFLLYRASYMSTMEPWRNAYACFRCNAKFDDRDSLEEHYQLRHPEIVKAGHQCENCKAFFTDAAEVSTDSEMQGGHACPVQQGESELEFRERMDYLYYRYRKPVYKCNVDGCKCTDHFTTPKLLRKHHLRRHSKKREGTVVMGQIDDEAGTKSEADTESEGTMVMGQIDDEAGTKSEADTESDDEADADRAN